MSTTNKKEWQKEHFKTNKTPNESQFVYKHTSHVTKAAAGKFFYDPKKWERFRENKSFSYHSRKSGSIQERSILN